MRRQRTRPHAQARRQRRGYVVKRPAAMAAVFLRRCFHAQPVAARGTCGVQALHRPAGQSLHRFTSRPARRHGGAAGVRRGNSPCAHAGKTPRKNWRDCAPSALGVSIEIDTISGGYFPEGKIPCRMPGGGTTILLGVLCVKPGSGHGKGFNEGSAEKAQRARRRFGGLLRNLRCATASSRTLNYPESLVRRGFSALFASRTAVVGRFLGGLGFSPGVKAFGFMGLSRLLRPDAVSREAPEARCSCARNF